jgi:hypothetical protein
LATKLAIEILLNESGQKVKGNIWPNMEVDDFCHNFANDPNKCGPKIAKECVGYRPTIFT